jgi:hypothetical protein
VGTRGELGKDGKTLSGQSVLCIRARCRRGFTHCQRGLSNRRTSQSFRRLCRTLIMAVLSVVFPHGVWRTVQPLLAHVQCCSWAGAIAPLMLAGFGMQGLGAYSLLRGVERRVITTASVVVCWVRCSWFVFRLCKTSAFFSVAALWLVLVWLRDCATSCGPADCDWVLCG